MVDLAKILHSVCYTSVISKCNDIVILLFRCISNSVFLMMITTVMKMTTLTTVTMMTMMTAKMMMTMMPLGMTIMTTMRSSDAPDI